MAPTRKSYRYIVCRKVRDRNVLSKHDLFDVDAHESSLKLSEIIRSESLRVGGVVEGRLYYGTGVPFRIGVGILENNAVINMPWLHRNDPNETWQTMMRIIFGDE